MTTQINARVVCDSISPAGKRLTTYVLEYQRFIHPEFMTHRVFSRNASSSRAIPVEKQIQRVVEDPALPVFWGKNQAGMQAAEELSDVPTLCDNGAGAKFLVPSDRDSAKLKWLLARDEAVRSVKGLQDLGLHKQLANRLLEPWMWISVVCTATEYGNWYNLRYHKMAQPEIQVLAQRMWEAQEESIPVQLKPGEWHLPFITNDDYLRLPDFIQKHPEHNANLLQKVSAARCARVSYRKHDGTEPDLADDCELYQRLMGGFPKHASPTEHQARVPQPIGETYHVYDRDRAQYVEVLNDKLRSNLDGWIQFRKLIPGEYAPNFPGPNNPKPLEELKP